MSSSASARIAEPEAEVRISLIDADRVGGTSLPVAEAVAARILAATGARVRWIEGDAAGAIVIRFLDFAPEKRSPDYLAEANHYATRGVRITVFLDRVWGFAIISLSSSRAFPGMCRPTRSGTCCSARTAIPGRAS
jgi:hypothetical protein